MRAMMTVTVVTALLAAGCQNATPEDRTAAADAGSHPAPETADTPESGLPAPGAIVHQPEAAVRALYGQEIDETDFPGWVRHGARMVFWGDQAPGPEIGLSEYRSGDRLMLLTTTAIGPAPDGAGLRWRLVDGVALEAGDDDFLANDCKLSLNGEFVPGLVAIIRGEPIAWEDGYSALLGPARAAFHIDRLNGRIAREEATVYCNDEAYGV